MLNEFERLNVPSAPTTTATPTVAQFVVLTEPIYVESRDADLFRLMGPRFDPSVAKRPMLALFYDHETAKRVAELLNAHGTGNGDD